MKQIKATSRDLTCIYIDYYYLFNIELTCNLYRFLTYLKKQNNFQSLRNKIYFTNIEAGPLLGAKMYLSATMLTGANCDNFESLFIYLFIS